MKRLQNVTIKGTKEGITLHLDDSCSYNDLKQELDSKLSGNIRMHDDQHLISVKVQMGNRYLTNEQEDEIKELIRKKKNLVVEEIVTNVVTKEEAQRMKEETEIVYINQIIRSGQVVEVPGDMLLVGDVNPGGTVKAGGNIFVMGALKGIAHAGCYGSESAFITAAIMRPQQLRISDLINRPPDKYPEAETQLLECAYIDENRHIVVDRIQALNQIKSQLMRLEGGSY